MSEFISNSELDTARLGNAIGESLVAGTVIALNGTLGSGKTRLTQAIGNGLGIAPGQVVSPTFTICVPHSGRLGMLHIDAYRINHAEEVDELGLDELAEDGTVLIVEWANRIEQFLPAIDLEISIDVGSGDARTFRLAPLTDQGQQLVSAAQQRLQASPSEH